MSESSSGAVVRRWLAEPMPDDVAASIAQLARTNDVQYVAVMPDVHLSRDVCIGTAVATTRLVYPAAVGGDIGCGMAAVQFDADAGLLSSEHAAARLLSGLHRFIPTNRHSAETMPAALPSDLREASLSDPRLEKLKSRDGRVQLGTLGRGNHFLEFQADQHNQLWLMVHSGSRAMGQAITAHHLRLALHHERGRGMSAIDTETRNGKSYLNDVQWALQYAERNRRVMVEAAARLMRDLFGMRADWSTLINSHHNHVRCEEHFGRSYWVHRKGAQSAADGELGVIPGSTGTTSFHVMGRGCEASLCSSSHGAGRMMARTEARKRVSVREFHKQMASVWFDHRRANTLRDEAPAAYKDIRSVMRAQKELTRIVRELRPLLSYKGR